MMLTCVSVNLVATKCIKSAKFALQLNLPYATRVGSAPAPISYSTLAS